MLDLNGRFSAAPSPDTPPGGGKRPGQNFDIRRKPVDLSSKSTVPRPTEAELELLRVIWERGPLRVREVHDADKEPGERCGSRRKGEGCHDFSRWTRMSVAMA